MIELEAGVVRKGLGARLWMIALSASIVCPGGISAQDEGSPLEAAPGWYESPSGDRFLLSPAPGEGFRRLDFANADFGSIKIGPEGDAFQWVGDAAGPALRAPDGTLWSAQPDAPYGVSEVSFVARDGVRLEGVLLVPRSLSGRGAVLLHGSGSSDRDNVWAYTFAHALAQRGITVLFPDKRGSGGSEGDWRQVGLDALARDAVSGAEELARWSGLSPDSIGWVGLSQGGWVAPLAARISGRGAFVISVSAAAVPVFDQLEFEVGNSLREEGFGPDALAAASELQRAFRERALGRISWSEYEDARSDAITGPAATFAESTPADSSSWRWKWWARVGGVDPLESWATASVPTLVMYGAKDELDNVPVDQSVRRLQSLKNRPAAIPVDYVVYDDLGHALVDATEWVSATVLERLTTFALRGHF